MEFYNLFKVLVILFTVYLVYNQYNVAPRHLTHVKDPEFSVLGPYNTTKYEVNDVADQLIDLKNFSFKINPQPCENYTQGLLLVVIVSSKPDNYENRKVIRDTWGRSIDSMKVVFLLGETSNYTTAKHIYNESLTHRDIVQGTFHDAYRNMTYKHVMGLKWVAHHCSTAKYVLKTDDDVLVNSHELRHFLTRELSPWGTKGLILCKLFKHSMVSRSKTSKWYVTEEEYPARYYPIYCAGMAIIYSQDVIPQLLVTAQNIPYFWIDDVHITGVIAGKAGINRTPLSSLVLTKKRGNMLTARGPESAGQFLFGPQDLKVSRIVEMWKAIPQ
ncbi:galactosyltransferase domain-containing protein [Phthorimaea operculella]|nr:galactosyltransferase domain-containing protein [Phthorimaea operculella]